MVGALLMIIAIVLVWVSAWLKGRTWFLATVGIMAASVIVLERSGTEPQSDIYLWATRMGLVLFFLVFCYVVAGRYLTGTSIQDLTYNSHHALVKYIDDSGDISLFARVIRMAGPLLFIIGVAFAAFLVWAKFTGAAK